MRNKIYLILYFLISKESKYCRPKINEFLLYVSQPTLWFVGLGIIVWVNYGRVSLDTPPPFVGTRVRFWIEIEWKTFCSVEKLDSSTIGRLDPINDPSRGISNKSSPHTDVNKLPWRIHKNRTASLKLNIKIP